MDPKELRSDVVMARKAVCYASLVQVYLVDPPTAIRNNFCKTFQHICPWSPYIADNYCDNASMYVLRAQAQGHGLENCTGITIHVPRNTLNFQSSTIQRVLVINTA